MNRSIRAISACWRSIARPSAISRAAASRRHWCHVPRKFRARPASSSRGGGAAGWGHPGGWGAEAARRVEAEQRLLEPLERLDVEVVRRLVEQEQVGLGGERAGERGARERAAREGRERPAH